MANRRHTFLCLPHSSVWSEHTAPAPVLQFIVTVCSEMFMLTASKAEFSPKPCEHPETGKLAGKDTSRTYSNTVFNGLNIYLLVKIHKSRIQNSVSRFLIKQESSRFKFSKPSALNMLRKGSKRSLGILSKCPSVEKPDSPLANFFDELLPGSETIHALEN